MVVSSYKRRVNKRILIFCRILEFFYFSFMNDVYIINMKSTEQKKLEEQEVESRKMDLSQLVLFFKGLANPFRLKILNELIKKPGLNVEQITILVKGNFKTISVHLKKMERGRLLSKRYKGLSVHHYTTLKARNFFNLVKKITKKDLF